MPRVGIGYDSHRFREGRPLVLGGVAIPHPRGLDGHSDADVLVHAVIDALLGAAGAGDIGSLFPETDCAFQNASSINLLERAAEEVRRLGYAVGNIDAVVVAEEPRLLPHREAMRRNLAKALGIDEGSVFVKGKTNEGMGAIGGKEGIAAYAAVLLVEADSDGRKGKAGK
ncbi:MAG: 2-C-methyl-D-erythritol 2,4-cyclodiphosphate synthase [Candidatus Eisenbacteria bacterium]|nr:2-C-methyl-D-erythritol 2,4-cyclodiphosphate synthase [Candidatus Eisenbacteria bacterium]